MPWFSDFSVAVWRDSVSACSLGRCQRPTQSWLHCPKVASHTNIEWQGGALPMSLTTADNNITVTWRHSRGQREPNKQRVLGETKQTVIRKVCKVWQVWWLGLSTASFSSSLSHSLFITHFRSWLKLPALIRRTPYHLLCCSPSVQQKTLLIKMSSSEHIRCHDR